MKKKPVIGVMPLFDEERDSIWMLPGYFDGLKAAGAIPVMLPLKADREELEQLDEMFDGYLFTGGPDISPELYGETANEKCGMPCEERDKLESYVFDIAAAKDKPILGICRGIQLVNVLMGGTLYQDIPTEYNGFAEHHMTPPYDKAIHYDDVKKDTPLYELIKKDRIGVNSYHHQAIKKLADDLRAMAVSEDGLIEAVYGTKRKFLWAVQWHPEFSYKNDENAFKIFKAFVTACNDIQRI